MVRGSCLCGGVSWESSSGFELMSHCHCSMCRKIHGSPFATYVATDAEGFRLRTGEDLVARYESSPGSMRPFCSRCGSVVAEPAALDGQRVFMPAGNLDDDPGTRPEAHIFVASKAPWHEITDGLRTFDAYPPGWSSPELIHEVRPQSGDGVLRGSCLCGAVAWESEQPTNGVGIRNCHCRRCRKSRSAAHASNLLLGDPSGFRWIQGEENLERYAVPEAKRFTSVFCRTCGSLVPRVSENALVIPAGGIDGDPGVREESHIFVAFKAPWYEITDDLPRHDESPAG